MIINIPALSDEDNYLLAELWTQLDSKMPGNVTRANYYDDKYRLEDLGISIPPKFRNFNAVLGWPAMVVDELSHRLIIDGFVLPGQDTASIGVDQMWSNNNMDIEAFQAHDSAMIHACAFICTILGDTTAGEPPVLMMVKNAFDATGMWCERRRALRSALSISSRDRNNGEPTYMVMYLPDRVVVMERDHSGAQWQVEHREHQLGRVPVEPLVYNPRQGRPFGASRITPAVMSITNSAVRTVVRSEIGAEFYTAPQRYALNLPADAFQDGGWSAILGRVLAVEPPGMDDMADPSFQPQVGQFPQMSMQPHLDQLRMWAMMLAGSARIPVNSLGIVQDNPSSAEAIAAQQGPLVQEAQRSNLVFGVGWARAMRNALMLQEGLTEMPDEWMRLAVNWRDPATPTKSAAADAMAKTVAVLPWIAESDVVLEKMGWDRTDIERAKADRRRSTVGTALQAMRRAPAPTNANPAN
jgi:hypothetical protein